MYFFVETPLTGQPRDEMIFAVEALEVKKEDSTVLSFPRIKLSNLVQPEHVIELDATSKLEALQALCQNLSANPRVLDGNVFLQSILRREEQASTGIGLGIAIPHVKIPQVSDYVLAVGRVKKGIPFDAQDGEPVHLIFMIGASDQQTREFVRLLALLTSLIKDETVRRDLLTTPIPDEWINTLATHER